MPVDNDTKPNVLTPEDFYRISCIGELSADPSGQVLAWRETCRDKNDIKKIHRKDLQTGLDTCVSAGGKQETSPTVLRDGTVLFLSDGPDAPPLPEPGSMELRRIHELYDAPQLYLWREGTTKKLSHFLHGVAAYQVSPDEQYALLTVWNYAGDTADCLCREREPEERERLREQYRTQPVVIDKVPFVNDREQGFSSDRKPSLWLLCLRDEKLHCLLDADCSFDEYLWTPNSKAILYSDTDENGNLVFLQKDITDTNSHSPGRLNASVQGVQGGFDGLCPCFSADGRYMLFAGNLPDDEYNMPKLLYAIPSSGGENVEPVCLIDPDKTVDGIMPDTGMWTLGDTGRDFVPADDGYCYFTSAVCGSLHLFRVPINSIGMADPEQVCEENAMYTNLIPLQHGDFLCIYTDALTLPEIAYIGSDGVTKLLTCHNPWLKEKALSEPAAIWAETENQESRVQGWVLLPPHLPDDKKIPAILYIHGGPNGFAGVAMDPDYQFLADAGYAVIYCNPRGSSGYGRKHGDMELAYGEPALQDLLAVVEEACRQFPCIDPERIGVTGGSYGGYGTIWCASHSDRFRAGCAMRPLANMRMIATISQHAGNEPSRDAFPQFADCMLEDVRQSPNSYADNIHIPLQIMQSEGDRNCVPEQMHQLYHSMRTFRPEVPCRMILYPDSGHGLLRNGPVDLAVKARKDQLAWFDTYL